MPACNPYEASTVLLYPTVLVLPPFHQWQANLRISGIHEIKTIPCVPASHPFIERLFGIIRREYLDHLLFWNESGLERKLDAFKDYYNGSQIHQSLNRQTPEEVAGKNPPPSLDPKYFVWRAHFQGLFQKPIAG
jgi:putative transposase